MLAPGVIDWATKTLLDETAPEYLARAEVGFIEFVNRAASAVV
jgi:hypothetical protein